MKIGIDQYIAGKDLWGLQNVMLLFLAALIGETVAAFAHHYFSMLVAQRCLADLRAAVFAHVQKLPMSYFDRNPVGRLVTRMTTDVDVLQEMFSSGVLTLVSDLIMVVWIVSIMFYLNVGLALVSLALIPPMMFAINFFRVKARQNYRQIRERIARVNAYLGEAISGMMVIQLFSREAKTYREFEELNADHRDAYHLSNSYEAALYSMVEAAGSVSLGLLLWYGGGEVLHGIIGIGTVVAFKEYVHRFFVPMRDFSQKYAVMQSAMASAERIFQLLDTEVDIQNPQKRRGAQAVSRRSGLRQRLVQLQGRRSGLERRLVPHRAGGKSRRRRRHRLGQDDHHQAAQPLLRYPTGLDQSQRRRCARLGSYTPCAAISAWCCRMCFCFPATCAAT